MTSKSQYTVLLILLSLTIISCGSFLINSNWANDIDKENWRKLLTFFEDEKISISAINNKDELKIYIASADRGRIMQVMGQGLTFWISKSVSNSEKIGIKYPLRKDDANRFKIMNQNPHEDINMIEVFQKIISEQNEFLLVNENNFPLGAYPIKNEIGVEPKIEFEMGQFIYSIKVPLKNIASSIFDIQYQPAEKMLIGFEIEEVKREGMNPGSRGQGMGAGGRNPRSGGMQGGRREGRVKRMNRPEPLDISLEVILALM